MSPYQPSFVNGEIIQPGGRECAGRYALIQPVLAQYKRPFLLLDIGANAGYFSFRAAYEFDQAYAVLIEPNEKYLKQCLSLCKQQTAQDRLIVLNYKFKAGDFIKLKKNSHFDAALCLSVLHHMRDKWQAVSEALIDLADYLIIEHPDPNDKGAKGYGEYLAPMNDWWKAQEPIPLGLAQRGTSDVKSKLQLLFNASDRITHIRRFTVHEFDILSNVNRILKIQGRSIWPWVTGINGWTYALYNGVWPDRNETQERMIELIRDAYRQSYSDPSLGNIVLSGHQLTLIDNRPVKAKHSLNSYIKQVQCAFSGEVWLM